MTDTLDQMSLDGHLYPHGVTNQNLQTLERSRDAAPCQQNGGGQASTHLVSEGNDRHEHGLQIGGVDAMHEGPQQPPHAALLAQPPPQIQLQHHGHKALL